MSKEKSHVLIIKKRGFMLNRFSSKIWTYDHLKHCNAPPCKYAWSVGIQSTDIPSMLRSMLNILIIKKINS